MIKRIFKENIDNKALSKRADRHNIFRVWRFKNDHGFYVYALENSAEQRKIYIPKFVFGRFRSCVREIIKNELNAAKQEPFTKAVTFLNHEYFYFKSSRMDLDHLIIQDIEERDGSSGYITLSRSSLSTLDTLLYSDQLQHPSDVLEQIFSYHKLFQFSFVRNSKSITSDLNLRKDILQTEGNYYPSLAAREEINQKTQNIDTRDHSGLSVERAASNKVKSHADLFKPKLGERIHEKEIKVDYGEIFGEKKVLLGSSKEKKENDKKTKEPESQFSTPLSCFEIKNFDADMFNFELDVEQSSDFRNNFLGDRLCDFYLGFEITNALFTYKNVLKTFQFPLYYMKVRIRESGRQVYVEAQNEGKFYLNHLALANMVQKFCAKTTVNDAIEKLFDTLLSQHISVDRINDRITLSRHLPINEDIFTRTREILFGYSNENGKGGILRELKFNGVECDLHSVILYRAPALLTPVDQALENDLDRLHLVAHHSVQRFYQSLLGKFLCPELEDSRPFSPHNSDAYWLPGRPPKSMQSLLRKLQEHDLVLLEGPPGTGKTHTIMHLLIDAVCSEKRILIVSDQQAAVEALVEKLHAYLARFDSHKSTTDELLAGSIKIIDEIDNEDPSLSHVADKIMAKLKTKEPRNIFKRRGLDKKHASIQKKIEALSTTISEKMRLHCSEDLSFEQKVPPQNAESIEPQTLVEFLSLILDENSRTRQAIDAFVKNRLLLLRESMASCYSFFKIPSKNFDNAIQQLEEDARLLSILIKGQPTTISRFQALTKAFPRHELYHYLESILHSAVPEKNGIKKFVRQTPSDPLHVASRRLLLMIQGQISLLSLAHEISAGLWSLLRETHENIRLSDMPNHALALYFSLSKNRSGKRNARPESIQKDLEEIDDLYRQQEELVYAQFVTKLSDIITNATTTRRRASTNAMTRVMALSESLKKFESIEQSGDVFDEFRQSLSDTFPIWIMRKQFVPLLLPCTEQSFDLVIVDEATQCRVDDAMSLLFRAKKMIVVGDENQTVLKKNSVVDDYLFKDHDMDEHLRSTQAQGFKGGGSNIFSLVKSIRQASVMLDEHYRCPADIIEFSNRYVYNNELKIMQWQLADKTPALEIDDSESNAVVSKKPSSGKFKGIETKMVDRFFDYITQKVYAIEKDIGRPLDFEKDIALCYFLLKNDIYIKHAKEKFLSRMNRGESLLDGAGAALQGKERDYIFYFWDITRYNIGAFKQGDDQDKRKGELNVLMSRPKKQAFHFLHHAFPLLDHNRSDITRHLQRALMRQKHRDTPALNHTLGTKPSIFSNVLQFIVEHANSRGIYETQKNLQNGSIGFRPDVVVGDARRCVDLIAYSTATKQHAVGLIDLSGFYCETENGEEIIDYYFQLKRAAPKIDPVFLFPYELADEYGHAFRSLIDKLDHII